MDANQDQNKQPQAMGHEQLPPALQWENMEAGIFSKMEALQAALPPDEQKPRRRLVLLGMLFLALLFGGLLLISNVHTPNNRAATANLLPSLAPSNSAVEPVVDAEKGATPTPAIPKEPIAQKAEAPQAAVLPRPGRKSPATIGQNTAGGSFANTSATSSPQGQSPLLTQDLQAASGMNQTSSLPTAVPGDEAALAVGVANPYLVSPVAPLASHGITAPVLSEGPLATLPAMTMPSALTFKKAGASTPQVWMTGGAAWWNAGYGSTAPERAGLESAIPSYQGQISFVQPVKKGYFLLVGVQYQQLESRFDWNTVIQDFEVTLEDTIIQIQRNALTGEEINIRGDVTLTVPADRQVRHFNSVSTVQIPFGIGKIWGSGRLQPHLTVGAVANLSFTRQGRTLYQTTLVEYDGTYSEIWTDKPSLSAMLSGGFNFRVTKHLGLVSLVQYQHNFGNWSAEQGVVMKPRILNCSFGVRYAL